MKKDGDFSKQSLNLLTNSFVKIEIKVAYCSLFKGLHIANYQNAYNSLP